MIHGSDDLEAVLQDNHTRAVRGFAYQGPQMLQQVDVSAASLTVDTSQFTRRSLTVTIPATPDNVDVFSQPSTCIRVQAGALVHGSPQFLPVHWGVSQTPSIDLQAGTITLTSPDLGQRVVQDRFTSPRSSTPGATVPQMIQALVRESIPWVGFEDQTGDSTVVPPVVWTDDRAGAVTSLAQSIGAETFLRPDGVWVLRYVRSLSTPAEYRVTEGATLASLTKTLAFDQAKNVVVATCQRADGTTLQGISEDDDPSSPLFVGVCGRNVGTITSSLYTTVGQCVAAAYAARVRLAGYPVGANFTAALHPGVEAGDRVDVIYRRQLLQLIPDSLTFDLTQPVASFTARSATRPLPVVS